MGPRRLVVWMISVYITCKNSAEAKKIAKYLLSKRLIACANIFPAESIFRWRGKIVEQKEAAMLCKARKKDFEAIEKEVKRLHSYKVPCITAFEWARSSREFSEWVEKT